MHMDIMFEHLCCALENDPGKFTAHIFNELLAAIDGEISVLERTKKYATGYSPAGEFAPTIKYITLRSGRLRKVRDAVKEVLDEQRVAKRNRAVGGQSVSEVPGDVQ